MIPFKMALKKNTTIYKKTSELRKEHKDICNFFLHLKLHLCDPLKLQSTKLSHISTANMFDTGSHEGPLLSE